MRTTVFVISVSTALLVVVIADLRGQTLPGRPSLRATAASEIAGRLVVDEKGVRRLREVLAARMAERAKTFRISYKATFEGGFYYETEQLDVVLTEDNAPPRRITALQIVARSAPQLESPGPFSAEQQRRLEEALLSIESGENPTIEVSLANGKASYSISGASRDWVLNTQVDISERLGAMVVGPRWWSSVWKAAVIPVGITGFALMGALFKRRHDLRQRRADASYKPMPLRRYMFAYTDPGLRLNHFALTMQLVVLLGAAAWFAADRVGDYFTPGIVFALGAEIQRYAGVQELGRYILTGIVGALVVGIVASIIANLATRRASGAA